MACDRCSYRGEPCVRCTRLIAQREDPEAFVEPDDRSAERRYEKTIYEKVYR